jgi:hypothetical protein
MVDYEKMSDEQLLSEECEVLELLEQCDFGSCSYDFANLDLCSIEVEKEKRGLK